MVVFIAGCLIGGLQTILIANPKNSRETKQIAAAVYVLIIIMLYAAMGRA